MNDRFKNEHPDVKRMFDTISTTLTFVSQAYSYYHGFTATDQSDEERTISNNEVFRFQKMSAQFFMVVQFCKLFESHSKEEEGDSSLSKLSNKLNRKYSSEFKGHSRNTVLIKSIRTSEIFKHLLNLRNKCYGHSENHPLNPPMKFAFLKKEQLEAFKQILLDAIQILNNCYALFNTSTDFHHFYNSTTPRNFLRNYARSRKYWIENKGKLERKG